MESAQTASSQHGFTLCCRSLLQPTEEKYTKQTADDPLPLTRTQRVFIPGVGGSSAEVAEAEDVEETDAGVAVADADHDVEEEDGDGEDREGAADAESRRLQTVWRCEDSQLRHRFVFFVVCRRLCAETIVVRSSLFEDGEAPSSAASVLLCSPPPPAAPSSSVSCAVDRHSEALTKSPPQPTAAVTSLLLLPPPERVALTEWR